LASQTEFWSQSTNAFCFTGEDFWRWQTMNPLGYRSECGAATKDKDSAAVTNGTSVTNGNH